MISLNKPILWTFRRCPYAMRTRLAVKASGIKVYLREIQLRSKPEAFVQDSEKATVPVLKLPDGKVIEESLEIMSWALSENDPGKWQDIMINEPDYSSNFLRELDGDFKQALDRYKYANRYHLDKKSALDFRDLGSIFLAKINKRLMENAHLSGPHQGFLDVSSLPFVRQFRIADPKWFDAQDWPKLHIWLQDFLASSQFDQIMEKLSPWSASQGDGVLF